MSDVSTIDLSPSGDAATECADRTLLERAREARDAGDHRRALSLMEEHVRNSPDDFTGWNELGALRFQTGDATEGINCLRKAVLIEPTNPTVLENLIEMLVAVEQYDAAAHVAFQWTQSAPRSADAWVAWARLNLMADNASVAKGALETALDLDPQNRHVRVALNNLVDAQHARESGDVESASTAPLPFLRPLAPKGVEPARSCPPILWSGPALSPGGYAYITRQTVVWLHRAGLPVELDHLGDANREYVASIPLPHLHSLKSAMDSNARDGVCILCHQPAFPEVADFAQAVRWRRPEQSAYVGLTMFETTRMPAHWVGPCNRMDEVWVPSRFNVETFAEAGVHPDRLRRVGFGIDARLYNPDDIVPAEIAGRRSFMFLSVFQWHARKGWRVLVESFGRAFTRQDDVCLVIKTSPARRGDPSAEEQMNGFLSSIGLSREACAPIILIEDSLGEEDMRRLYRAADAFCLPTRGEGWGIPFMEAMAMGLPTIGTRWSGHLDFMTDDNSYLVDIRGLIDVEEDMIRFNPEYAGLRYADPDPEHLTHFMRRVFEDRDAARRIGLKAREDIRNTWRHDQYVQRIGDACRELAARSEDRRILPVTPPEPRADTLPVMLHGPALDPCGYAHDFRNLAIGLRRRGVEVHVAHQRWNERDGLLDAGECAEIVEMINRPAPEGRHIAVENPLQPPERRRSDAYRVLRIFWESDRLHFKKLRQCLDADEVWAPSEFTAGALVKAGVEREKIRIIPTGLQMQRYGPHVEPMPWADPTRFTFLACFDFSRRKGWDLILGAFFSEFGPEDAVRLALNVHTAVNAARARVLQKLETRAKQFAGAKWLDEKGQWRGGVSPLHALTRDLHADDMPRFYRSGDAYLMPSRGEGWGIPAIEAIASGLPVIATGWGGQMEYMNPETEWLLPYELRPIPAEACREAALFAGQMWAEPDSDALRRFMRQVRDGGADVARRAEKARQRIREKYDVEAVAAQVAERVAEISRASGRSGGASRKSVRRSRIVWEGCQLYRSSLALVNRELCSRLADDSDCALTLRPTEPERHTDVCPAEMRRKLDRLARSRSAVGPCDIYVRHGWPPDFKRPAGAKRFVIIQPWEYGRIPDAWVAPINESVDEMWVPSRHVFESYVASGVSPVKVQVVPNGVDTELFKPQGTAYPLQSKKSFRFLFVGGTIWRKGIDTLLKAYCAAFGPEDDVALVIKEMGGNSFYRGQCATDAIGRLVERADAPEVVYLQDDLSDRDMASVYRACHCLVHPYRGEGFGLPVAEAAACGLPVVVTLGGATDDFVPPNAGYFVAARRQGIKLNRELATSGWVLEPDVSSLVAQMRRVYEDPAERRLRTERLSYHVRDMFSWDESAEAARLRIRALTG